MENDLYEEKQDSKKKYGDLLGTLLFVLKDSMRQNPSKVSGYSEPGPVGFDAQLSMYNPNINNTGWR